jgi:two-component system nitrate/nitrite response regulator NarL
MQVITLSIVDPHPVYRRGLARLVAQQPDLRLLAEAPLMPAVSLLAAQPPDILLVDPVALKLGGETLLRMLVRRRVPTRVLLLASVIRDGDAYRALGAGAAGYLSKCSDERELIDAIHQVARGQIVIAPELQSDVARGIRLREADPRPLLSARECEILELTAAGMTAPEMSRRLHVSASTVRTHLLHLYEKLGVAERAAAVAQGIRLGLIE